MMMASRLACATFFVSLAALVGAGCDARTIVGDSGPDGVGGDVVIGGMLSGVGGYGVGGTTGDGGRGVGGMGIGGANVGGMGVGGANVGGMGEAGAGGQGGTRQCPVAGVSATPTTIADMRAALSRRWVLCSPQGLLHRSDEDGVEITVDDRYSMLTRDPATGQLGATHGVDFEGGVEYLLVG